MENITRNKTNTNNNNTNTSDILVNIGTESLSEGDAKMQDPNHTQRTPAAEVDPFKRVSKLGRSPVKSLSIDKPIRARSSPPVLCDTTPQTKSGQPNGDCMSELGEAIKKLVDTMRPPQRSINNNMRDLLSLIVKLHSGAQEEQLVNKDMRRNILVIPATAETTPKRPHEEKQVKRNTPPKKNKTTHREVLNTTALKTDVGPDKEPKKDSSVENKAEGRMKDNKKKDEWIAVKSKQLRKSTHKPTPRPDAIIIERTGNMSYSDILRVVKKDDTLQELGENVARIRKTVKGEILIQLKDAQMKNTGEFKTDISKVLGEQAQIRALTHEVMVEIRDLDEITTKEDIAEAIQSQIKELKHFDKDSIKNIRSAYLGTQTATISLPAREARILLEARKIKIGWVVCRVRTKQILRRCFRCLEYGHFAKSCSNPDDRSKCCVKCGETGHFAKTCTKKPSCTVCKKNGRQNTDHQIGSTKCPIYQEACKSNTK
ncbi:uncharacterized protein LOC128922628 [Zeugodacus cucurbitae]|uniref:uncharacterized protein LOC128922628 n=1 Tax=Zeugodacus cucurbitae TaxID=28588 RepID=UPI0023D95018|nr:uncharacterized protein LOC128922628 [Zeugodacus cucurbitae]